MRIKKTLSILAAASLCFGGSLALASPALACGGFFCSQQQPVDQAGERVLFIKDGEDMITHVQIQYTGDSKSFSWVLPVPTKPELSVGSDQVFTALRNATRPQFQLNLRTEGQCKEDRIFADGFAQPLAAAPASAERAEDSGVQVLSQGQVGPFESAVIQSKDPAAIKKWLTDNGYDIPPNVDPLLEPYIKMNMPLLALRLQKDRSSGDLQPIVIKYKAEKPMIPIQLTAVAATEDMDVYVWVLGKERAIPENYLHAKINEARIDWMNQGNNYRSVVTEAINEAGGRGFVTDYAGDSSVVPSNTFDTSRFNLSQLQGTTDPIQFAQLVVDAGYFPGSNPNGNFPGQPIAAQANPQLTAFLSRHIRKPASLGSLEDDAFYGDLASYRSQIEAEEITVNTAQAVQELKETIIAPLEELRTQFSKNNYLTQLYSTISPKEMTVDPVFQFNGDMPKVSNMHEADGVRQCTRDVTIFEAPIEITLKDGTKFKVVQSGVGSGRQNIAMPAAASIERLSPTGLGEVVTDNAASINKALGSVDAITFANGGVSSVNPNQGFGCACAQPNSPPPFQQGAGEGATYAFGALGFLAWRRRRKKQ